ncbi:MAG: DMT family transporter [Treponema sp.]|nr:DMT family transporter [Treponema sp.]
MIGLHSAEGRRKPAVLAIIICVLIWGFSFISIKVAVSVFPPMTLGAVRFAMALVLLFTMYRVSIKRTNEKNLLTNIKKDLPLLICSGLMGITFYFFGENNGVALVSASEASIIVAAIPVLTVIADWLFSRISSGSHTQLGWRHWLGAVVSMAGVVLVAGISLSLSGSIKGYLYMGGAALCWVVYGLLTRPLFERKRSRIYVVFWQNLFGFIGFLPFAFLERAEWTKPSLFVFCHVLFLGLCCSAMGYWLYAHALEILGMSVTAVFINLIPVVTVIAGFFILGDRLTVLQFAGAVLVIAGVYLTVLPMRNSRVINPEK